MTQQQLDDLELAITQCDSTAEFEQLVRDNANCYKNNWGEYVRSLMVDRGLSFDKIASGCGVSYNTARSFAKKAPTKRINVIFLAMMMGLSVEETNRLLVDHAKYHRLYTKNPADVIAIYLLVNGGSPEPKRMFDAYYQQYCAMAIHHDAPHKNGIFNDTEIAHQFVLQEASHATVNAVSDRGFYLMMQRLIPDFSTAYKKLLDYIQHFFIHPEAESAMPTYPDHCAVHNSSCLPGKRLTPNERFQQDSDFREIYYKNIRKIRDSHEIPSRSFLISLGVRLNMDVSQINEMLHLAGMGPLYANDRIEAAVVYVLEELFCQIPTYFTRPRTLHSDPTLDELQVFSITDEIKRLQRSGLPVEPSTELWLQLDKVSELPPEHLNDYLKRKLEEMCIFEGNDRKSLEKFLSLL